MKKPGQSETEFFVDLIESIMEKENEMKKLKKQMRSDTEILKDLIDAVMEYNSLRDDEWDFNDNHGSPDFWGDEENDAHDELVADILRKRREVRSLIVEATGDENISF